MKVPTEIAEALDQGPMSVLMMLDLSAAFDAIDHLILLKRLDISLRFKETALL